MSIYSEFIKNLRFYYDSESADGILEPVDPDSMTKDMKLGSVDIDINGDRSKAVRTMQALNDTVDEFVEWTDMFFDQLYEAMSLMAKDEGKELTPDEFVMHMMGIRLRSMHRMATVYKETEKEDESFQEVSTKMFKDCATTLGWTLGIRRWRVKQDKG